MRGLIGVALATAVATSAFGGDASLSYADARGIWEKSNRTVEYQAYVHEFAKFNNHFQIDKKDGCNTLGPEPVGLMLVITHADGSEFAVVGNVLSDADSPKARCFKKSYLGLRTKVPPYVPFVLQMQLGALPTPNQRLERAGMRGLLSPWTGQWAAAQAHR